MQNQIIRFLPEIIVGVFGIISAGSLGIAMAVHAHIEQKYPGFNEAMRPWCRYFRRKAGLESISENSEDPKSRS